VLEKRRRLLESNDHDEEDDEDDNDMDDDEDDGIEKVDVIEDHEKAESNESESVDDPMEEEDNIAEAAIVEDMAREVKGTPSYVLGEVFCHAIQGRVDHLKPLTQPFSSFAQIKMSRSVMASTSNSCLRIGRL